MKDKVLEFIDSGNYICEKCGKEFEWVKLETHRDKLSSGIGTIFTYPELEKHQAHTHCYNISDSKKQISVNCPYCYYDNLFYVTEEDLQNKE